MRPSFRCSILPNVLRVLLAVSIMVMVGCPHQSIEKSARDGIATSKGYIDSAISHHQTECQSNSRLSVCQTISKAGYYHNAAVTALESYCNWPLTGVEPDLSMTCHPIQSAESGLRIALTNLDKFSSDIREAAK